MLFHKVFEQLELLGSQSDLLAAAPNLMTQGAKAQVAKLQFGLVPGRGGSGPFLIAPDERLGAGNQFCLLYTSDAADE